MPKSPSSSSSSLSLAVSLLPFSPPSRYSLYLTDSLFPVILHYVPFSVHPNVITFLNSFSCLCLFALSLFARSLEDSAPLLCLFVRLFTVFLVFLSLLLDCLDGMQARRTNQCSTYGEYLDHSLDSLHCVILSAVLLMIMEPDDYTLIISLLGSSAIYHGQAVLYRYSERMIDPPVNGMEAQTLLAISLGAFSLWFFYIPRTSAASYWLVLIFSIVGNIGQFQNTAFFFRLLFSLDFFDFSLCSILFSHVRTLFVLIAYCVIFLVFSFDRALFFLLFLCLSYRINGRYVLVTLLYQKCKLGLSETERTRLYQQSEFCWPTEELLWLLPITLTAVIDMHYSLTPVVSLFCLRMLALNLADMRYYRAPLMGQTTGVERKQNK
jgi:phosphatidylglycerophosphate synthase